MKNDKKQKTPTDELIIAGLMQGATVSSIAKDFEVTPRTIYNRMATHDFRIEYQNAKTELITNVTSVMVNYLIDAIETIGEIMNDKQVNAATRLQAAQTLLANAGKFIDRQTAAENKSRDMINPLESMEEMSAFLRAHRAGADF